MEGLKEIHSDQVMFDDRRTLSEIMAEVITRLQILEGQTIAEGSEEDEQSV